MQHPQTRAPMLTRADRRRGGYCCDDCGGSGRRRPKRARDRQGWRRLVRDLIARGER